MGSKIDKTNLTDIESFNRVSEELLTTLYSLLQAVKIYDYNNILVREGVANFVVLVNRLLEEDKGLTIKISNGRFFIQDQKLLHRSETAKIVNAVLNYFEERNLIGLRILPAFKNIPLDDVLDFARLLNQANQEEHPQEWLSRQVEKKADNWLEILNPAVKIAEEEGKVRTTDDVSSSLEHKIVDSSALSDVETTEVSEQESKLALKKQGKKDYSYALASLKEISGKLLNNQRVGIRKTLRLIQNIVKHIIEDESIYLALSTIRIYDDYTYTHSVNVALLAMCLGKNIGLSKNAIERLGLCALFHDLGKLQVPIEILNKPGRLNKKEVEVMEQHSLNSARLIMNLHASIDRKAKILLAPFEHHLKYNLSGYPHVHWRRPQSLFGRILAIADVYDALTSPRIYRSEGLSPTRAVEMMLQGAGKDFDPILMKAFVTMLGGYPLGTLVELDNGEIGIVSGSSGQDKRPRLTRLIPDAEGGFKHGGEIDLTEQRHQTGEYLRNIVKTKNPAVYGIQPAEFIL